MATGEQPQNQTVRSVHSMFKVKVKFTNASKRTVDLYWLDFKGNRVKYVQNVQPGTGMEMNTYVSHPWVAHDSVTGQLVLTGGKRVFIPSLPSALQLQLGRLSERSDVASIIGPYGNGLNDLGDERLRLEAERQIVDFLFSAPTEPIPISIPVFRLEDICIGFFRKQLNNKELSELEVNRYLSERLQKVQIDSRPYVPHNAAE